MSEERLSEHCHALEAAFYKKGGAKVIGRARALARAAGGLLDATPSISPEEWAVLDYLGSAFGVEA